MPGSTTPETCRCGAEGVAIGDYVWHPHTLDCEHDRLCANPECRRPLDRERVRRWDAITCNRTCRAAAWKARTGYGRMYREQPARRRANGRSRSGLQVSYFKTVDVLAAYLFRSGLVRDSGRARRQAELLVKAALSDAQRRRLEARS